MLWIKAFHIIFTLCWFAGIFYLPRLFVYHAMSEHTETRAQLSVMEYKLYRFVTPFAILAIGFGLWLMLLNASFYLQSTWFLIKLAFVIALVGYHIYCGVLIGRFKRNEVERSHIFFRWFNEAPVIALFVIVIMVVVKPL